MWKLLADVVDYHCSLLEDRARCLAFRDAIHQIVRPGDVVLDIGTGTGLLSLFACQAGASRVYAIEQGLISDVAELMFKDNSVADRVTLIRGNSSTLELPEQVDVVVSETLWNFGLGEGILRTFSDAASRFLKPGGRLVPRSFKLRVAPIEYEPMRLRFRGLAQAGRNELGVDLSRLVTMAKHNMYRAVVTPEMLLSPAETIAEIQLGVPFDSVRATADFVLNKAGNVVALGGFFEAELAPGCFIGNEPPNPAPSWKHALMPLGDSVAVCPGDLMRADVECPFDESAWRWLVSHVPTAGTLSPEMNTLAHHSTLCGFPTARERLCAP